MVALEKRKDNVSPLKLSIADGLNFTEINRDHLAKLQREDKSLDKLRVMTDVKKKEIVFLKKAASFTDLSSIP